LTNAPPSLILGITSVTLSGILSGKARLIILIGSAAAIVGLLKRFRRAGSDWSRLRRGIAKSHCSLSGKMSRMNQRLYILPALLLNGLTVEEKDAFVRSSINMP
jgi:hypothetical protein